MKVWRYRQTNRAQELADAGASTHCAPDALSRVMLRMKTRPSMFGRNSFYAIGVIAILFLGGLSLRQDREQPEKSLHANVTTNVEESNERVDFLFDYDEALTKARRENKPVIVVIVVRCLRMPLSILTWNVFQNRSSVWRLTSTSPRTIEFATRSASWQPQPFSL